MDISMPSSLPLSKIPTVNLGNLYNEPLDFDPADNRIKSIARNLAQVLHQCGFAYIENHGISETLISGAFSQCKKFFELPLKTKVKYAKRDDARHFHGYGKGREMLQGNLSDRKEKYDILGKETDRFYPDEEIPGFKSAVENLDAACRLLSQKLLKLLAVALELDDVETLAKMASDLEEKQGRSSTTLESLYYPKISGPIEPGTLRCGEHSDFGVFTILFQDNVGGLEVKTAGDEWIRADPIPGTFVFNIGNVLQRWTAGYFPATPHRVVLPVTESDEDKRHARQSFAFFLHPDEPARAEPLESPIISPAHQ